MTDKKVLLENIDKLHTTEIGIDRIKKNLNLNVADVVTFCKTKVCAIILLATSVFIASSRKIILFSNILV